MPSPLEGIGAALRLLRNRYGIPRADMPGRGGPAVDTIAKVETDARPPDIATLDRYLVALGATAHDLAYALDEVHGLSGKPARPDAFFVDAVRRAAMEDPRVVGPLVGLATMMRNPTPGMLDAFVASAAEAARQVARRAVDELQAKEPPA